MGAGAAAQDFNRRTVARFLARELERIGDPDGGREATAGAVMPANDSAARR